MKKLLISVFSFASLLLAAGTFAPVHAQVDVFQNCGANADTAICKSQNDKLFGPNSIWTKITNTLIYVTGAISALMIVVGGLRYTLSNGDQGSINGAKNTIMYAVVGLVLSVMGYAIVNFVLSRI